MVGKPRLLRKMGPARQNFRLAARVDRERTVGKHGPAVFDGWAFVVSVQLDLVGAGQVVESLPIRRERRGKGVESNVFATIEPESVARNLAQHLEAVHELDDAAGLKTLPRINKTA